MVRDKKKIPVLDIKALYTEFVTNHDDVKLKKIEILNSLL